MRNLKNSSFLGLLFFLGLSGCIVYLIGYSPNTSFKADSVRIVISTHTSRTTFLKLISPYVKNERTLHLVAKVKGYYNKIQPGVYTLHRRMGNCSLINTLKLRPDAINVTFNNADTLEELASKIASQIEAADSASLVESFRDSTFLKVHSFNLENALTMYLPNTYQLYWNTTADEFRNRMLKEYHRFWNPSRRSKAAALNLTPMEVYSLASIVNKESKKVDERPRIAGVYLNLLRKGDKLRADPTVIFALKKAANDPNLVVKRVLYKDLKIDSPYNTYRYYGVPPGPICMPDRSSLEAVLTPEEHQYYYFVVDVEHFGYHVFASSLKAHNKNKRRYIRWINERKIYR